MSEAQKQAALQSMTEWLAHPQELGKQPNKIECAGEFDLHDMHYYIFRYKQSMLGKWLVGVCGGYEGDSLEHCGHVFSEMEPYDQATAEEKCIAMVEQVRSYWMQQAANAEGQEEREGGPFVSFVLLKSAAWDKKAFVQELKDKWDIVLDIGEETEEDNPETLVGDVNGMMATVGLMPAPVPDGEAEHNAASNYLWPQAVEVTKTHKAHLLVAVLPRDNSFVDAATLLAKLCDICLSSDNAIGVYTSGTVFQPEFYRDGASVMKDGELPYLNWIYFGLRQSQEGWMSGYTFGLEMFGKDEIEVVDTKAQPGELRSFLFNIASYVISSDVTLLDGETIGYTADMKLPITRSEGFNLDGMTLKIGFMPAKE